MIGEVCKNCECYITPPNPWPHSSNPKMCQCKGWKYDRDKEAIERMMEIDRKTWERIHDAIMNPNTESTFINKITNMSEQIPPHISRLEIELAQLNEKIEKLKAFLDNSDEYFKLTTTERVLLEVQLPAMETYAKCLKTRLLIS